MRTNDEQRPAIFRFGIRHAIACTFAFAVLFFVAVPRYPSATTISLQRASKEVRVGNVASVVYYYGHDIAYLTMKSPISDGENDAMTLVCVSDPSSQFASELQTAGIPYSIYGTPATSWMVGFGTGIIAILALLYLTFTRNRRNHAVHRRTACAVIEVENQSSVLGDG